MFERVADWSKVVGMIGDIVKGTSTLSLRRYTSASTAEGDCPTPVFGWDYQRVQAHARDTATLPSLVSDERLQDILSNLTTGCAEAFSYEIDAEENFEGCAQALAREFSGITVFTVRLAVGAVHLGWFVVLLHSNRDVVHWKMRYHERNARPGKC